MEDAIVFSVRSLDGVTSYQGSDDIDPSMENPMGKGQHKHVKGEAGRVSGSLCKGYLFNSRRMVKLSLCIGVVR